MFDHMKEINKIVNQKILEIETVVTKSESNFVEEIHKLIRWAFQLVSMRTNCMRLHKKTDANTNV